MNSTSPVLLVLPGVPGVLALRGLLPLRSILEDEFSPRAKMMSQEGVTVSAELPLGISIV